jgi:DNA-binding transcriptional ArsR family regulator
MVEQEPATLDAVFHALADPTRRAMLRSLAQKQQHIGQLAAPFAISFAAASKHVKVLERAGLVHRHIEGRMHICRIEPRPLAAADHWLRFYEELWTAQLDALAALFDAEFDADEQAGSADPPPEAHKGSPQ